MVSIFVEIEINLAAWKIGSPDSKNLPYFLHTRFYCKNPYTLYIRYLIYNIYILLKAIINTQDLLKNNNLLKWNEEDADGQSYCN